MPKNKEEARAYNREAQRRWRENHRAPCVPDEFGREYVYLFRKNDLYKIGRTIDMKTRRGMVAVVYQATIDVVHSVYVRFPALVEMEWDWRFRHRRSQAEHPSRKIGATEWYALSDQDVAWVCSQQGDEVLRVDCTMGMNEAVAYLQQEEARITFLPSQRVRVHLPIWSGYYVERDTLIEAACVVKERLGN